VLDVSVNVRTTAAACRNVLPAFVLLCPVLAIDGFIPEYKMRTQFYFYKFIFD
jgi:hypothetical protein